MKNNHVVPFGKKRKLTNLEKIILRVFPDAKLFCQNCNKDVNPKLQFCSNCGTKV